MTEEPELGPVGTKLLISNELVNVWEVDLKPGEAQPWHSHEYPYVVISMKSGRARVTEHGTGRQREGDTVPGNTVFDPGGATHTLENIGDTPTLERLIEFKTPRLPLKRAFAPGNDS